MDHRGASFSRVRTRSTAYLATVEVEAIFTIKKIGANLFPTTSMAELAKELAKELGKCIVYYPFASEIVVVYKGKVFVWKLTRIDADTFVEELFLLPFACQVKYRVTCEFMDDFASTRLLIKK